MDEIKERLKSFMDSALLAMYTVSFFGHRTVNHLNLLEKQVEELIRELLSEKQFVEFLVGRNGEFDLLVSAAIRRVKKSCRDDNSCHTLVLPRVTAECRDNRESFEAYYDDVVLCDRASRVHFKAALQTRNRAMVNQSDLVVFYIDHESGGAFQTYRYAVKTGKAIIKLPLPEPSE